MSDNLSEGVHTVSKGETLLVIARNHGVTLSELLAANPEITDPGLIRLGQTLRIPAGVAAPAPAAVTAQPPALPEEESVTATADPNAILLQFDPKGASEKSARSGLMPAQRGLRGVAASEEMARSDRKRVMLHKSKFIAAARLFGLPPALLAAIASRETRGGSLLDKNGEGDGGHGFGLMQVDIQNPVVVREGGPAGQPHINQAAKILRGKLDTARRSFKSLTPAGHMQVAVSRYNGGNGLPPPDSDRGTTFGDYMNDVWARARFYARVEDWDVA